MYNIIAPIIIILALAGVFVISLRRIYDVAKKNSANESAEISAPDLNNSGEASDKTNVKKSNGGLNFEKTKYALIQFLEKSLRIISHTFLFFRFRCPRFYHNFITDSLDCYK